MDFQPAHYEHILTQNCWQWLRADPSTLRKDLVLKASGKANEKLFKTNENTEADGQNDL